MYHIAAFMLSDVVDVAAMLAAAMLLFVLILAEGGILVELAMGETMLFKLAEFVMFVFAHVLTDTAKVPTDHPTVYIGETEATKKDVYTATPDVWASYDAGWTL